MSFCSGNPVVDRYIAEGYNTVRGMSSAFAATICGHMIRRQSELGIKGHIAEIGTFEGRFFIAMALGLADGERALGIDTFNWPNDGLLDLFHGHCARHGLANDHYTAIKGNVRDLSPDDITKAVGGPIRFWHVDGDHSREHITLDLDLALETLHPQGIIVLDDMLHPGYPTLLSTVLDYLARHREMCVLAILDREDIVAAAKFVICREKAVARYEGELMQRFARFHYTPGAHIAGHFTLVLSPQLREVDIGWDAD